MSAILYENLALDWSPDRKGDIEIKVITVVVLIIMLVMGVMFSSIEVPKEERKSRAAVPERIAKFVMQKEKPKPIVVKPKLKQKLKPKPKPKPKIKKIPRKKKAVHKKTITKSQKKARKKAESSGLLALGNELADLIDTSATSAIVSGKISRKSTVSKKAASVNKQLLMADAGKGSGGVSSSKYKASISKTKLTNRQLTQVRQSLALGNAEEGDKSRKSKSRTGNIRAEEDVTVVFDQNKSKLYSVYNRARRKDPGLKGKIVLEITILSSGKVSKVRIISSELNNAKLEKRLVSRIKQFNFGPQKVESLVVVYPIEFLPS
jgi:periplasmic protein TonB